MQAFANLADAVQFLAEVLANNDYEILALVCREKLPQPWVLERLRERHESTPLPELYSGWEFPQNAKEFTLGGHDMELGHIHIDFVKSKKGWTIKEIWMCR
jgi:hypothetical protein